MRNFVLFLLMVVLLSGLLLAQDVQHSCENYAADIVAGYAQLTASVIGDTSFQLWNAKFCRPSLVKWLQAKAISAVNIDIISINSGKIGHRTQFTIAYDGSNGDLWKILQPMRQAIQQFYLEHQSQIKCCQYRLKIVVEFIKTPPPQPGWSQTRLNDSRLLNSVTTEFVIGVSF